jgi:hypothetical protein
VTIGGEAVFARLGLRGGGALVLLGHV